MDYQNEAAKTVEKITSYRAENSDEWKTAKKHVRLSTRVFLPHSNYTILVASWTLNWYKLVSFKMPLMELSCHWLSFTTANIPHDSLFFF